MKIWFNKIHDSRRATDRSREGDEVTIGRDPDNTARAAKPARLQAAGRRAARSTASSSWRTSASTAAWSASGRCSAARPRAFSPGETVRIWPYHAHVRVGRSGAHQPAASWRPTSARSCPDLELRVHRKLLERLDLYELETQPARQPRTASCCSERTSRTSAARCSSSASRTTRCWRRSSA